jgi:molybdopterin/thiamine biosynthesis adenylyltransferase/molybdopterin synthase catalytic subunit
MFELTEKEISSVELSKRLAENKAGALVTFEGWVRDHNQGLKVKSLEYQVYESLALKEGAKILHEAKEKFNLHGIECVHRHGHLKIGEIAVWVGASASHRDEAFKATRYVIDEIKHRLPIWKKEHYLNQEPEWVYCQHHATHVHFEFADYFRKQCTVVDPAPLRAKKVIVIGAGGLGCPALQGLATSGIGFLTIIDPDQVDVSNLHRQPLYRLSDVGEKKAILAVQRLNEMNEWLQTTAVTEFVNAENAVALLTGADLVLDCTDTLATKFLIHDVCFALKIPLVSASIYRFEGQLRTFLPNAKESGCLRCLYPTTPDDENIGNCNDFGVLGAAVSALGSLQASQAIQFLSTGKSASVANTHYFDFETLTVTKIKNLVRKECEVCSSASSFTPPKVSAQPLEVQAAQLTGLEKLIDIREDQDPDFSHFIGKPEKIVIYCHKGIRSQRVAKEWRARGVSEIYSLVGGAGSL